MKLANLLVDKYHTYKHMYMYSTQIRRRNGTLCHWLKNDCANKACWSWPRLTDGKGHRNVKIELDWFIGFGKHSCRDSKAISKHFLQSYWSKNVDWPWSSQKGHKSPKVQYQTCLIFIWRTFKFSKYCSLKVGPLSMACWPRKKEINGKYMALTFHIDSF